MRVLRYVYVCVLIDKSEARWLCGQYRGHPVLDLTAFEVGRAR